jgi:hypothetical protein
MSKNDAAVDTDAQNERERAARDIAVARMQLIGDRLVGATRDDDDLRDRVRRCRAELEAVESLLAGHGE